MDPQDVVPTDTAKSEPLPAGAFGAYRLLQRIREGGMGETWLAEQTAPLHPQVALKGIKVVAQFEAERQAFALRRGHGAIPYRRTA